MLNSAEKKFDNAKEAMLELKKIIIATKEKSKEKEEEAEKRQEYLKLSFEKNCKEQNDRNQKYLDNLEREKVLILENVKKELFALLAEKDDELKVIIDFY